MTALSELEILSEPEIGEISKQKSKESELELMDEGADEKKSLIKKATMPFWWPAATWLDIYHEARQSFKKKESPDIWAVAALFGGSLCKTYYIGLGFLTYKGVEYLVTR